MRIGLLAGILLTALLPGRAMAGGSVTCDYDPLSGKVTLPLHEGFARITRSGNSIQYAGYESKQYAPCGAATVNNTDKIVFVDSAEYDRYFEIDQSGGRFEPGKTNEPNGRPEIEFDADYAGPDYESMFVATGTPEGDRIVAGDKGLKLNRDDDMDVRLRDVGFVSLEGLRGDDFISLAGGEGTGAAIGPTEFFENSLTGGQGNDRLIAGPGLNSISGGSGGDVLRGAGGVDSLLGNLGNDRIHAGRGDDRYVHGGKGNDTVRGGWGDDWIRGNIGNDHLSGNVGDDTCEGGPGDDVRESCELS